MTGHAPVSNMSHVTQNATYRVAYKSSWLGRKDSIIQKGIGSRSTGWRIYLVERVMQHRDYPAQQIIWVGISYNRRGETEEAQL